MARLLPLVTLLVAATARFLPSGPLIACYTGGGNESQIIDAAVGGCNVIIWSFIILTDGPDGKPNVTGGPDRDMVARVASTLRALGLPTTHLVSTGGWNAPHPSPAWTSSSPSEAYAAWVQYNANMSRPGFPGFDGLDWDLEGNDDPTSPQNFYDRATLDLMGTLSQLLKAAGYIVTLVPPQSYLDYSTPLFSLNVTNAYPEYQPTFRYHGLNTYAYVMSRFGVTGGGSSSVSTFDFIMVQFYETFSRAHEHIVGLHEAPADYLVRLTRAFADGFIVDFSSAPSLGWGDAHVSVPPAQLVWGLANGWTSGSRALFISADDIGAAYGALIPSQRPRGAMFWCIGEEGATPPGGSAPLYYAPELNAVFLTRP